MNFYTLMTGFVAGIIFVTIVELLALRILARRGQIGVQL